MKQIKRFTLLICLIISQLSTFGQLNWENYLVPQKMTDHIELNQELWISSHAGVLKVDKNTLQTTIFDHTDGLPSVKVEAIAKDQNNVVWIGTYDQALARWDGQQWVHVPYPSNLFSTQSGVLTYCLEIDAQNVKWIGTNQGLVRYDDATWTLYNTTNVGNSFMSVWDVNIQANGKIQAASFEVYELDGSTWTNLTQNVPNFFLYGGALIHERPNDGSLWIANLFGSILHLEGGVGTVYNTQQHNVPFDELISFGETPLGGLYIVAENSGKFVFENGIWNSESLNVAGLDDSEVLLHFYDGQGVEWASDNRVLFKKENGTVQNVTIFSHSLMVDAIASMASDNGTNYFINGGRISVENQGVWTTLPSPDSSLLFANWSEILVLPNHQIWLSSSNYGLFFWDGQNWTNYNTTNSGLPDNAIRHLSWDAQQQVLWVGSFYEITRFDGTNWTVYNAANAGFPTTNAVLIDMVADKEGNCFASFTGQIFKFDGMAWSNISTGSTLPGSTAISLFLDNNNAIWGTFTSGISRFDGTTWHNLDASNSILQGVFYKMTSDANGKLYAASSQGVYHFNNDSWEVWNTTNTPLLSNSVRKVMMDDNGYLWIAYTNGLSRTLVNPMGTATNPLSTAARLRLENHPNPFVAQTTVVYELRQSVQNVHLTLFSADGRTITDLILPNQTAGIHSHELSLAHLPNGIYWLQLTYKNYRQTISLVKN